MTSRRGRRFALLAAAGLGVAVALTACAPVACPAVGWFNALTVHLEGDASVVDRVQLCTDAGCAPNADPEVPTSLGSVTVTVTERDGRTWTFSVDGLPDAFTVRTLAADGTVLADTAVTPQWHRVGGSEQCGGPAEATVTAGA